MSYISLEMGPFKEKTGVAGACHNSLSNKIDFPQDE